MEELKLLTKILKYNLKVSITPYFDGMFSSVILRVDGHAYCHMKYMLPVNEWQASAIQEPLILSNVLARLVDAFVDEYIAESEE